MAGAMSDADVFGAAPTALSDEDVFGPAPKPISDAAAGLTDSYFAAPRFEAPKPTGFIDLIRHPILGGKALLDFANERASDSLRHYSSVGGAAGLAADAYQHNLDVQTAKNAGVADPEAYARQEHERRIADERAAAPRAAGSVPEQVAGFLGDVGGTILAPESMVALPEKAIAIAGRPVVSSIARHAAGGAVGNTIADAASQGTQLARGYQDEYNPLQTALAPVEGAVGGAALGAGGHAIGAVGEVGHALKAAIPDFETPAAAKPSPAGFTPATVDNLWEGLTKQEHGLDKEGHALTSPKGARGVAQLEPATAEDVANRMGKPELAAMAMGDGPLANTANEILGKFYLNEQLHAFGGDPVLALAAYNAGPGKVRDWLKTFGTPDEVGRARWLAMIPYHETRNYVHAILGDVAGEPHTLTPEDTAYMRGRMQEFPTEAETPLPPIERAAAAADEAAQAHADIGPFPEHLEPQPTGEFQTHTPWDDSEIPGEKTDTPGPKEIPEGQDFTDQALNQLRSGKKLPLGEGPSLIEALVKAGGLKDDGGEIADILGGSGENRLHKMLRRVKSGMDLDEAAQWAQERGYIGRRDLEERAGPQELLDALRREVAGDKVYPPDRVNEHARALLEHMNDLDEIAQHLGIDLEKVSNPEARRLMDEWYNERDGSQPEPGWDGMKDTGEVLGMNLKGAMATGAEAVQRVRDAHQRAELRNEIMASTRAGMLPGSRTVGAVPSPRDAAGAIDAGAIPKIQGVPEIIRTLADALGYPVRQGRISLRNALGTYNRRSGMVRSKGRYDLNVLAHEFGHALEFTDGHGLPNVMAAMKAHTAALKRMDYNQSLTISRGPDAGKPPPGRRHEGFAEWFRWYITNPDYADTMPGALAFRHDFEAAMAKDDPKGLAAIQEAQRSYQAFLDAPSLAATREHVVAPTSNHPLAKLLQLNETKGPMGALKDLGDEAYRGVVDFLHPWQQAVKFAEGVVERRHGFTPKLAAIADPYKLLRSMASVSAVGHMDLIHGVHGYQSLEPESPSFAKALAFALGDKFLNWDEDAIRDFGTYLVGRRVLDLYDSVGNVWKDEAGRTHGLEAPPDALSRKAWAQTVSDLDELNPHWQEAAGQLYEWNNALWKKRHDAGLIGQGEYLAGLEDHPNYVPLFRDISDKEFGGDEGGMRGPGTKNAGGVVRLKGSDRAYINPLHSMMNMAYELNAQIARNDALVALDNLGQLLGPDIGQVVERIPSHQIVGTTTSVDEVIANAAKRYGVSRRDAAVITESVREMFGAEEDDAMNTAVYRAKAVGENGEPIVYAWRDGQRIPLRLPDGQWGQHMVEGLAGMTPPIRSAMLDIAAIPAAALRAGVTAHPAFFLANSFRDQMSAFVLTNVGYRPFVDQARGLGHEMGNHIPGLAPDELTRIYNVASGEIGGYQSAAAHEAHAEKDLQALRQRGASIRHFATWNGFAHFTEVSETGTRLGIFERALKDAKARGFSDYAAAREAAYEARDYMDFDRHGAWGTARVLARVIPFMNAGIQALDKTRRVASGITLLPKVIAPIFGKGPPATAEEYREFNHAMKLWITASALAVGGLAIRAAYKDDPEYQEVADTLRNTHWVVKLPNGYFAAIPKPYEIAVLSNIFERAFEASALHDPTAWGRLMQGLEDIFIPAHDPAFLMPAVDVLKNRDNLGAPIVPDYLKGKLARDQYTDRTSDIAKWLGGHVGGEEGVSPAVIDFLAKAWGGSNMRDLLDASHRRAPVADSPADTFVEKRFVKDWTRGAVSSKQFYDLVSASDGRWGHAVASLEGLVNEGKYPEAVTRLKAMDPGERAYVMASVFAKGEEHDERDRHHGDFVKQDHPLIRAQAAASAFSGFARDLMDGNVRGPDLQPVAVTPEQRRDAVRALRELAVSEQRNGLIMAGVEGWTNRQPLPETKYLRDLAQAAPQLMPALVQRFKDEKVQDIGLTAKNWTAARNMLEAPHDDAVLTRMMMAKRFPEAKSGQPTGAAMKRAMSDVVPVSR